MGLRQRGADMPPIWGRIEQFRPPVAPDQSRSIQDQPKVRENHAPIWRFKTDPVTGQPTPQLNPESPHYELFKKQEDAQSNGHQSEEKSASNGNGADAEHKLELPAIRESVK
jgi:hypothetical protein